MTSPIRYGRQLTMTSDGTVMTMKESTFTNFQASRTVVACTETIHVKDEQEILANFLQLLDKQKSGDIDNIGLQVIRNQQTGRLRIEKSWVVPQTE